MGNRYKGRKFSWVAKLKRKQSEFKCPNCGEMCNGHFVPPSLGEGGFFICEALNEQ